MFCPRCGSKLEGGYILDDDVKTFTIKGVSFKMTKVDAGTFLMGDGYKDSYENTPIHEVKITKDYIAVR